MPQKTSAASKREELIEISSRLFYEQGYGATGIKQVIEEAGIAKGTFYSHFSSKEELGVEWLKGRHREWMKSLNATIEGKRSPSQKLLAFFDMLTDWMAESKYRGCAFLNTMAETPDAASPMREEVTSHKQSLHDLIQEFALEHWGKEKSKQARRKGSLIYLLFEGALIEAQNFGEPWPIKVARDEVKTLLST